MRKSESLASPAKLKKKLAKERKIQLIDEVIQSRCTTKYLSDQPLTGHLERSVIVDILGCAGWAPVHLTASMSHRENNELNSILPWRFYVLDANACNGLREILVSHGDHTKVPQMLAAASALIQVTWLPDPLTEHSGELLYAPTLENMEHIAAGAAAIQNMLLAATAREIPTYWSSGGALRGVEVFAWLDIPETEILLGSVFLFPQEVGDVEVVPGKLRDKRGNSDQWVRWINFH